MKVITYFKSVDGIYISENFILKNNKIYHNRKKLTNNYKLNKHVMQDFLGVEKNIEGLIIDDVVDFATPDFQNYLDQKAKTEEMKKYNHIRNLNTV